MPFGMEHFLLEAGMREARAWIDQLRDTHTLPQAAWVEVLEARSPALSQYVCEQARQVRHAVYGRDVYIRGLIEISNYCKNNCYYCGIRRDNRAASRYRLSDEEILSCAEQGYAWGFRTFVLQGGEDPFDTDERLCGLIKTLKAQHPDCAITLSLGERDEQSYRRLMEAGADRYLLRHETASEAHYATLHPPELRLAHRVACLYTLKRLGYQVGSGFMVGSPGQTMADLAADLKLLEALSPQMVGIGPFIPHRDTPLAAYPAGSVNLTVYLLGLIRLMLPRVLLPATTALGTLDPQGREKGILAGVNVIMPNLSPAAVRGKYMLYDNKQSTGEEAAEGLQQLKASMKRIGYDVVVNRGDYKTD